MRWATLVVVTAVSLWVLMAVILASYVVHSNPDWFWQPDSLSYHVPALSMLSGEGFTNGVGAPEVFRTPGFSLFLAGVYGLFGIKIWPVILVHFLLLLATAILAASLVWRLAHRLELPPVPAALAAVITVLFSPVLVMGCVSLLSEILFVAVLTTSVYLLTKGLEAARPLLVVCGMAFLTAAGFVRPVSLYLPLLIIIASIPFIWRQRSIFLAFSLVIGLVVHLVSVNAWSHRNAEVTGEPIFATVQQVNLYEYVAASIEAKARGVSWEDVRASYVAALEEVPQDQSQAFMRQKALQVIAAHPFTAASVWLRGAVVLALQPATGQLATLLRLRESGSGVIYKFVSMPLTKFIEYAWHNEKALILSIGIGFLWLVPFWSLTVTGAVLSLRRAGPTEIILFATIGYMILVSAGPQTVDRFRAPLVPFCSVFVGIAIAWIFSYRFR